MTTCSTFLLCINKELTKYHFEEEERQCCVALKDQAFKQNLKSQKKAVNHQKSDWITDSTSVCHYASLIVWCRCKVKGQTVLRHYQDGGDNRAQSNDTQVTSNHTFPPRCVYLIWTTKAQHEIEILSAISQPTTDPNGRHNWRARRRNAEIGMKKGEKQLRKPDGQLQQKAYML